MLLYFSLVVAVVIDACNNYKSLSVISLTNVFITHALGFECKQRLESIKCNHVHGACRISFQRSQHWNQILDIDDVTMLFCKCSRVTIWPNESEKLKHFVRFNFSFDRFSSASTHWRRDKSSLNDLFTAIIYTTIANSNWGKLNSWFVWRKHRKIERKHYFLSIGLKNWLWHKRLRSRTHTHWSEEIKNDLN